MTASIDIFEPRTMLEAVEQMKPAQRWFLDNFFSSVERFDTISVDFDIYKDKRRIAGFDNPLNEGTVVDDIGFKSRTHKPSYMKPKKRTTAQQMLKVRAIGSHLYEQQDPVARAAAKLGADFAELDAMIARREEWMALKVLQTGSIVIDGDGDSRTIEFDFDSNHLVTLSGTALWSDPLSDPINNLLTWRRLVLRDSGMAPTDCVLGNDAAMAFLNHAKVKDWFNRWNFIPGEIKINAVGNVIEYGFIPALGMRLYTVNEFFIDPSDLVEKEMLDVGKVLLLNRAAKTARLYGAIQVVDGLVGVPRFPMTWLKEDPSVRWAQLHSAPLPVVKQPDAFLSAIVL